MEKDFEIRCELAKYDASLGLVLGWAIVCSDGGQPYFDLQGDHIPEQEMLAKSAEFMLSSRIADAMHDNGDHGAVVFAFPMTEEIKKAFDLDCPRTGLMIAVKPSGEALEKCKSGEFRGFSIGGTRNPSSEEVVDVEKYNRNHDAVGRFAASSGGGGGGGGEGESGPVANSVTGMTANQLARHETFMSLARQKRDLESKLASTRIGSKKPAARASQGATRIEARNQITEVKRKMRLLGASESQIDMASGLAGSS